MIAAKLTEVMKHEGLVSCYSSSKGDHFVNT